MVTGLGWTKDCGRIPWYFRGQHRQLPQNGCFPGVGLKPLGQWFSKCGPQSSSTWNLLECKLSGLTPDPVKAEAGGLEELTSPPGGHSSAEPVSLPFVLPLVPPRGWFRGLPGPEMGSRTWGRNWPQPGCLSPPRPPPPPLARLLQVLSCMEAACTLYNFWLRHNEDTFFSAVKRVRCYCVVVGLFFSFVWCVVFRGIERTDPL